MSPPDKDRLSESVDLSVSHPTLRILKTAWRHKSLLLLGLVVGLGGGALYCLQKQPVYQSNTQLMVIKKRPETKVLQGLEGLQPVADDYVTSHVLLLKSPLIIQRAVEEHDLGQLPSLAAKGDAVGIILSGLTVAAPGGSTTSSPVINLSYRSNSPEDCQLVLNALVSSYKAFLEETYRTGNKDTIGLITSTTKALREDKVSHEKKLAQLRAQAPDFVRTKDGALTQQDLLYSLDARRNVLLLRRIELGSRKSKLEKDLASNKDLSVLADFLADRTATGVGPVSNELRTRLKARQADLILEQKKLAEKFGPNYPDLVDLERQLKALQALLEQLAGEEPFPPQPQQRSPVTRKQVDDYLAGLGQSLGLVDDELAILDKEYKDKLAEFKKLKDYVDDEEKLRKQIAATDQLLTDLSVPLRQIDLVKDYGGYKVESLALPGTGGKVEPRVTTTLSLGGFAGLLLGGVLAWLAEVSDRSFRSPQEIRQHLGLPILGHVPHFDPTNAASAASTDLALALNAAHQPKSAEAEAYRGVRTALYYSTRGERHPVIQVTSPTSGDGKSTLCANLAISIAQTGKSVLLLDADFRRPRLHRLFNLSSVYGVVTVLTGGAPFEEAIQATSVPNLAVMPCGPRPSNPADLLTAPRFTQLLEAVRTRYDFVIIDTPPLLAVSDPTIIAPCVDGVVLTLRLSRTGRPAAERAKELLASVGATVLGVVVNGLDRKGRQGYGSDSGYEYAYQFTASYEADPDPDSAV